MSDKKDDIEQGTIDAYVDNEVAEAVTDAEKAEYLSMRLEGVKRDYKFLRLQQVEAEARKDDQLIGKLTTAFRENYKARKYCVQSLRALGQKAEDPFITA